MKILSIATLALAAQIAGAAAYANHNDFRFASTSKSVLEPSQEVPAADSNALANGIITFDRRKRKADIKVTFSNLSGEFTRLHLHCNFEGSNGPIAIGIVDLVAIGQDNSEVATLDSNTVVGTITDAQFLGGDPCLAVVGRSITDIRSLFDAIQNGEIYFNLHTTAFPAGEVRGQVEPLTRKHTRFDD